MSIQEQIAGLTDDELMERCLDMTLRDDALARAIQPLMVHEWNRRHPEDRWEPRKDQSSA